MRWLTAASVPFGPSAVEAYNEEKGEYGAVKPAHTEIFYSGHSLEVVESYEEVMDMIWKSEL